MSNLNIFKGFKRSSKKNRKETEASGLNLQNNGSNISLGYGQSLYSNHNGSALSLRRTVSPSKQSIKSQKFQQQQQQQQQTQQQPVQPPKPPLFMCEPFVETALVKGSFKTIVQLPKYVDYCEWLALSVFETFNHLNKFYGIISEYITPDKYPTMTADPGTEYLWVTANQKTVSLPAHQYIDFALTWISNKINDQTAFPTKSGTSFPKTFIRDVKNICRQMFRIFAHIYHNHFDKIVHLSLEAHWNSFFAHFISFMAEFDLIERKELAPLLPLIEVFESQGKIIKMEK
ncbi:unnamed protein product [Kuraishia capsulata CBS 1993]|uniref:Uncharacterized protein n=1 Tax=Kuraishia capsulata CBS 1993 TaxID=1382522 RepID=W6MFQ2_9ASCO|nr:uncharacterized protein KUCA_T00000163001 [Kuraishia capsulata CBS 1993]CDK24203.1 unnamed protein product [Kuraishia capsulata CBS 1993]